MQYLFIVDDECGVNERWIIETDAHEDQLRKDFQDCYHAILVGQHDKDDWDNIADRMRDRGYTVKRISEVYKVISYTSDY